MPKSSAWWATTEKVNTNAEAGGGLVLRYHEPAARSLGPKKKMSAFFFSADMSLGERKTSPTWEGFKITMGHTVVGLSSGGPEELFGLDVPPTSWAPTPCGRSDGHAALSD